MERTSIGNIYQDSKYSNKSTLASSVVSAYSFGDSSLRLTLGCIKSRLYVMSGLGHMACRRHMQRLFCNNFRTKKNSRALQYFSCVYCTLKIRFSIFLLQEIFIVSSQCDVATKEITHTYIVGSRGVDG